MTENENYCDNTLYRHTILLQSYEICHFLFFYDEEIRCRKSLWKQKLNISFRKLKVIRKKIMPSIIALTYKDYHYFTPCEFFTPASVSGLSMESAWLQVSSEVQDSSQYSDQSHQCNSLENFNSSIVFHFFQSLFQASRDRSKYTNYNWYHRRLYVLLHF